MSTPSGKPFDPIDPSASVSRRVSEQASTGQQPAEDDALRSPYAPKRLRVVHPPGPAAGNDDAADAPRFLFRASRLREQPVEGQPAAEPADTPVRSPELLRSHELPAGAAAAARHPVDLDDLDHPLEPGRRPRPAAERERADPPQSPPAAARPAADPRDGENDIERLEASLRWLKHQGADLRHQRASRPLSAPEPRPVEAERRRPSSRMVDTGMREPKPLEPESLLAPALRRAQTGRPRGPRWILIASLVAAPIAFFAVAELTPMSEPVREPKLEPKLASVELPTVVLAPMPEPRPAPRASEPRSSDAGASSSSSAVSAKGAKAPLPPISPPGETVAVLQPSPSATPPAPSGAQPAPSSAQPTPAGPVLRQLDRAEVQLLLRQGEQFVAAGDMVTARVVFQRAAETGDASAAMALGATYDPLVLAKLGVLGVSADVDKARNWYQKAKEFGSQDAPRRLELLANR